MTRETIDHRDIYLSEKGKKIYHARETKPGDILGISRRRLDIHSVQNIDLCYVESVDPKSRYWEGHVRFPGVLLKSPRVVLFLSEKSKDPCFFLDIPPTYKHWTTIFDLERITESETRRLEEIDERWLDEWPSKEFKGNIYLITDELLCRLGRLIPEVEIPLFSFSLQSSNPEHLFSYVKESEKAIRDARSAYNEFKRISDEYERQAENYMQAQHRAKLERKPINKL